MPEFFDTLQLSGPPKFGTLLMPVPDDRSALDAQWEPEHLTKKLLDQSIVTVQRRWRGRFKLGFRALSSTQLDALIDVVEAVSFTFTPRTAATGESAILTLPSGGTKNLAPSFAVRLVSPLPVAGPVIFDEACRYDVELELETVGVVGDPLPTPPGGTPAGAPPPGPIDTESITESEAGAQNVADCPTEVFFVETDPSAKDVTFTDGSDVPLVAGADGYHRFTKTVNEPRGYAFDIGSVDFSATLDGIVLWVVCPLVCVLGDVSSPTSGEEDAERDIEFQVIVGQVPVGSHTITVTIAFDCTSFATSLEFDIIKS